MRIELYAEAIDRYAPRLDAIGIDRNALILELLYRLDGKGDGKPCGGGWISKRKKCSKKSLAKLTASLKAGDKGAIARVRAGKKKAADRQASSREVEQDRPVRVANTAEKKFKKIQAADDRAYGKARKAGLSRAEASKAAERASALAQKKKNALRSETKSKGVTYGGVEKSRSELSARLKRRGGMWDGSDDSVIKHKSFSAEGKQIKGAKQYGTLVIQTESITKNTKQVNLFNPSGEKLGYVATSAAKAREFSKNLQKMATEHNFDKPISKKTQEKYKAFREKALAKKR